MTHIPGYIQAAIFAAVFMLFINGEIGSVLLYVIIGANIISIILILISKNHFTATLHSLSGVTECGRSVEFTVTLKKKGFCFIPFVDVCLDSGEPIHLRTGLLFRREIEVSGSFIAEHCGLNILKLDKVTVGDFLGNFRFNIPCGQQSQMAVLPRIIEYDGPEIPPNMLPSEEEESEEGITTMRGGMPGYEHREYVPGDSPRKVNYKLSAKRGRLMVRLDESSGSASTDIYISENALPVCGDKAFALASRLIMRGGTVRITHKGDSRTANTPETLDRMREWLAFRQFADIADISEIKPGSDIPPSDTAAVFSGSGEIITHSPAL